jgi:hypothetical protein
MRDAEDAAIWEALSIREAAVESEAEVPEIEVPEVEVL